MFVPRFLPTHSEDVDDSPGHSTPLSDCWAVKLVDTRTMVRIDHEKVFYIRLDNKYYGSLQRAAFAKLFGKVLSTH